jgi:hypothetical protein
LPIIFHIAILPENVSWRDLEMTDDFKRKFNSAAGRGAQGFIGGVLISTGAGVPVLAAFALGVVAGGLISNAILAEQPLLPRLASSFASACKRAYSRVASEPAALRAKVKESRPF